MIVRETIDVDIEPIFAIRRNPQVLAQQFRLTREDTPDNWRKWLAGNELVHCSAFRCTSICDRERVVGHITQRGIELNGETTFNIGFNLLPSYWGRGVMRDALLVVIPDLFARHGAKHVVASHFRGNTRCERLVMSLGFRRFHVSMAHRVHVAYKTRCWRWIRFRSVDQEQWSNTVNHNLSARSNE